MVLQDLLSLLPVTTESTQPCRTPACRWTLAVLESEAVQAPSGLKELLLLRAVGEPPPNKTQTQMVEQIQIMTCLVVAHQRFTLDRSCMTTASHL